MSQSEIQGILERVSTDDIFKHELLRGLGAKSKEDKDFKKLLSNTLGADRASREFFLNPRKMDVIVQLSLSGILLVVFAVYAYLTYAQITTEPKPIMVNGQMMAMYDPFTRAKDLLALVLPVFTIVLSFWLGFSIQENKVNEAKGTADAERVSRQEADMKMAKVEGMTMMMPETVTKDELRTQIGTIMIDKQA